MNLHQVVGRRKPPLLAPKEYPHSLLLELIHSPLRVSDIGLIYFCLDSVLFCHDTCPDLATWALAAEACGAIDPSEPNWPTSHTERFFKSTRASSSHWWGWLLQIFAIQLMQWCCDPQCHELRPNVWERQSEADQRSNRLEDCIIKQCPNDDSDLEKGDSVRVSSNRLMLGLKHEVVQKTQHIGNEM